MAENPQRQIPTIAERVAELLKNAPPLTEEQIERAARIYLAAVRSKNPAA
jgi:hypothetical protein